MHLLVALVMKPELQAASNLLRAFESDRSTPRLTATIAADLSPTRIRDAAAIVIDIDGHDADARLAAIAGLRLERGDLPVFVLASHGSESLATAAFRSGVTDYFSAPYDPTAIVRSVKTHATRCASIRSAMVAGESSDDFLLGKSDAMQSTHALLTRVAARDVNVLITGETGTGKELAARFIHTHSPRRSRRLVAVNCAAIPDGLLESELFGYERGAFTGAAVRKAGQLQSADGGTVFLDEIGDLGLAAQAKLLRAIESREISPLGSSRPVGVDIRIVAATNHDLERAVEDGSFRSDLYFRLNVARVQLPPLRARRSDVHLLVRHFVRETNRRFGGRVEGLAAETAAALDSYDWPGNVRELRNLVESACLRRDAGEIALDDLPDLLRARLQAAAAAPGDRERLLDALNATRWNVTQAAAQLRWSRMTIYRKIAKYHLSKTSRPA